MGEGASAMVAFPRQALHAMAIKFIHPATQDQLSFEAGLPQDFSGLIDLACQ